MTDDTEGMAVAHVCLLQGLLKALITRQILTPSDIISMVGDAEEYLAGLSPTLMTPGARDYARRVLQAMGKISY